MSFAPKTIGIGQKLAEIVHFEIVEVSNLNVILFNENYLEIFIRDEIRKELLHKGFLLILKLFPFSKSCSQVSHLIIKDLK